MRAAMMRARIPHDDDAGRVMRPSADATQEIRAEDVLESIDLERLPVRKGTELRTDDVASIAPVALEIYSREYAFGPEESLAMRIRVRRPPSPKLIAMVGLSIGLCIMILLAAGLRTAFMTHTEVIAPAAAANKMSAPPSPPSTAVGIDSLPPAPTSGTIVFPRRSAITLDGARVTSASAVVRCGDHTVRINRGPSKKIDVPCGGTLDLDKKR